MEFGHSECNKVKITLQSIQDYLFSFKSCFIIAELIVLYNILSTSRNVKDDHVLHCISMTSIANNGTIRRSDKLKFRPTLIDPYSLVRYVDN